MPAKTKIPGLISFSIGRENTLILCKILDRIAREHPEAMEGRDARLNWSMDLSACHANGNPLDFQRLLEFPDFDFAHDVFGIRRHIDRTTGKLTGFFSPRCSLPEKKSRKREPASTTHIAV